MDINCSDFQIPDFTNHKCRTPKKPLKIVWFNPETKEVFDDNDNLIGAGEFDEFKKTLKITRN